MSVLATEPNWAEQVTAIATSVGAVGLLGTIVAAIFAAQQVRESRHTRQAGMAIEILLGQRLVDRYDMWKPSLDALGPDPYPSFAALVDRMRATLAGTRTSPWPTSP